jgi:serine/threonine protein kinase
VARFGESLEPLHPSAAETLRLMAAEDTRLHRSTENEPFAAATCSAQARPRQSWKVRFAQADINPGTVLAGKYRVERVLGRGGMGVVVEARHISLDDRVALKFLLPEYAVHPDASKRFLREARAAVKIKGPHVARVSDVGTLEDGSPYMVMEYLEGEDASQLLARGTLPAPPTSSTSRPTSAHNQRS